ncbi:MAG: HAD family hydrolase [Clostridiales bacterium]|nr:HAD family hydrolase [Clostridiales bacterium]
MKYLHLFWDFDGTLYNSYPQIVRALRRTYETTGHSAPEDKVLLERMKNSGFYALSLASEETGIDVQVLRSRYTAFHAEETEFPPYEGMVNCVKRLSEAGVSHYLYTHRDRKALWHLERDGVAHLFQDAVTSDDGFPMKPKPDALLAMIQRNNLKPEQCLMIGDREIDILSGNGAGMDGLMFDPDRFYPESTAISSVCSMEEIVRLFGA